MMQMKEKTLTSFLQDAKQKAINNGQSQLISWTKRLQPFSLIDKFERVKPFHENRLFWANSERTFMLFGFGSAEEIVAETNRFQQLETMWNELVQRAFVHNPFAHIHGTGLVALGGMSFDPLRERSELWRHFPTSKLTIPTYVVIKHYNEYYLTINRYIQPSEHVASIVAEISDVERLLQDERESPINGRQTIALQIERDPEGWKDSVQKAVNTIKQNRAQKIVLARELRVELTEEVVIGSLIHKLMETQQQSYVFAYEQGDDCFIGASPERLVQVEGTSLLSTCLAGTAPRGK